MKNILNHTRNSLPKKVRVEIAALLQARLADSIDLMMQAKQAHWNLKGPHFSDPNQFSAQRHRPGSGKYNLLNLENWQSIKA